FRQRIFVILVALTAVPTALAVVGWALAVRTVGPSQGARVALEEMAASAREMLDHMDTTRLAPTERAALRQHLAQLSNSVSLARRAETYLRYYTGGFAAVVIVFGTLALVVAVRLAGHLSRQLSRPISWGGRVDRRTHGRRRWRFWPPRRTGWSDLLRSSPSSAGCPRGRRAKSTWSTCSRSWGGARCPGRWR